MNDKKTGVNKEAEDKETASKLPKKKKEIGGTEALTNTVWRLGKKGITSDF